MMSDRIHPASRLSVNILQARVNACAGSNRLFRAPALRRVTRAQRYAGHQQANKRNFLHNL